ncbi:MAG: diguanylate cyclase, partial [Pseudomonas sp.]|uniref:response regulator n=1 Tax=Pseudomonas sp. TaxID=306 RepID=UPI002628B621
MTEPEDPSRDRLKHHFAQRVTHQARQILEVWQRLQQSEWSPADLVELAESNLRLLRFAERFEQLEHMQLARSISLALAAVEANRGRLSSSLITELNRLMQRLSRTGLRHGDRLEQTSLPPLRKPIYVMLQDHERSDRLAKQLEFFGLSALAIENIASFHATMAERHPAAIVMDVDFGGAGQGLRLAAQVQEGLELKLPLLFFSHLETDTPTRLAAVRAGGQEFLTGTLEASSLLEKIEILTCVAQYEPYKVLIIDDSRAQATHTERLLNSAGIVTRTLLDPIQAMAELAEFQPDLIILDMYMPGCTGPELAKVIRHNDRYVSVPIIYLSAEDDLDKQLDAMSEGGDDFLTKPIKPRHLITTVRNRAARARNLKSRMVRDSLTGLYNHTHILQLLEDCSFRARREGKPLSFAMLDIDH